MVKNRRQFTKEFKVEAVRLIVEEGRRISEVARELGIRENLLGRWKKKSESGKIEAFPGKGRLSPEDAELLASRRFTTEELARLYGCPPPIIGDLSHGTFTNSETAGRWFAQHTLTPWIRKIETEFTRSVFTAATAATGSPR